ncbi:MAG: hypothetical protein L0Z50_33930 [Verrucomicrobiales bacterium]|nr:hypothetical protein [Verrucomicrobiales bacterium]
MTADAGNWAAVGSLLASCTVNACEVIGSRVRVRIAACGPAPSLTLGWERLRVSVGVSLAGIANVADVPVCPVAAALMVCVSAPSTTLSSNATTEKFAEAASAGITTVGGI